MKILAALIFFTRLPFWRIKEVPAKYFKRIVPYWPLAGWLTGGIMVGVLWVTARCCPYLSHGCSLFYRGCSSLVACTKMDWPTFFRRLRWRNHQRAHTCHHERLSDRKLWSHRIDRLFPIIVSTLRKSAVEVNLRPCHLRGLLV